MISTDAHNRKKAINNSHTEDKYSGRRRSFDQWNNFYKQTPVHDLPSVFVISDCPQAEGFYPLNLWHHSVQLKNRKCDPQQSLTSQLIWWQQLEPSKRVPQHYI